MKSEERTSVVLKNSVSGEKIFAVLHLPVGKGPFPAVVFCHGFGGTKSGRFRLFVTLSEYLAQVGIASFRFDYRGSGDSEGDPTAISFYDHVQDTIQAIEYVKGHSSIDSGRLGICGKSMGGAVATLAAHACPEIKALVLLAPMYHARKWQQLLNELGGIKVGVGGDALNLEAMPAHLLRYQGYPVSRSFVSQLFGLNLCDPLQALQQASMLIIEAGNDEVVDKDHAEGYLKSRQSKEMTKYCLLENSDHHFSYLPEQKILLKETCDWFLHRFG